DNLCAGIQQALEASAAANGQVFLLSDDDGCTWGDYFGYFASSLALPLRFESKSEHPTAVPPSVIARWYRGTRDLIFSSETKGLARRIYNSEPWGHPARWFIDSFPGVVSRLKERIRPDEPFVYRPASPRSPVSAPFTVDPIHAAVSAEKARRLLGYESVVTR